MESALVFKEEPQQTSTTLLSFNKADISIPNYNSKIGDNGKEIIIFNVKVQINDKSWTVTRRYNNFFSLYEGLQLLYPGVAWPEFPVRQVFQKQGDLDVRRQKLESFLKEVCTIPKIINSAHMNWFLEIKPNLGFTTGKKVIMPLPDKDFDPSESAIPWKILCVNGVEVFFATENGNRASCDSMLINPPDFTTKQVSATDEAKFLYAEMEASKNFNSPMKWSDIQVSEFDGVLLPGGHAPGMKQYLEGAVLQEKISEFWQTKRPVGAICHGALLLSRCKDPKTAKSVIYQMKTTTLPKYMENLGYYITRWKHGKLYRTYEQYCEDEVRSHLASPDSQFQAGPTTVGSRGNFYDDSAAFVVVHDHYVSARWPGDSYLFGKTFLKLLEVNA